MTEEQRDGVRLTNLDHPLLDGAEATKRDLVDYLDAVHEPFVAALRDRPLSVVRVRPGQPPFMQKNLPRHAPEWLDRMAAWAGSARREVTYGLCQDRRSLLWFANQRSVEFHTTLFRAGRWEHPDHVVLDIDPPEGSSFEVAARAAHLVGEALAEVGMAGAVKTSGAKGVHVFVPVVDASVEDAAAATRALAARAERLDPGLATTAFLKDQREGKVFLDATRSGGATVVSAYSPRLRPGLPVSFPVPWEELDRVAPADFTLRTVPELVVGADPWSALMPAPQRVAPVLVEEGHRIPVARVQAMHEGKRRARERRAAGNGPA